MANIQQIIVDAAQRHNVPVEALLAIAKIESGFDPNAQNPHSSASGPFQFTDKTAKAYGLTGDKRNDVAAQADAAARMLQTNARSLTKTLGRAPNAGELYLAHQQGLTGARALLANPDQTAAQALSSIYGDRAGSVVRQNGGDPNAKASQFASQWVEKGNNTARLFPSGELPTVGTLQDTSQPVIPPLPTTAAPNLAAMRANTSPTGGNSDLQTALDRVATRERNRVTPASADDRITARNRAWVEASPAQVTTVATIPSVQPPRPSLTAPGGVDAVVGGLQQDSGLAAALAARTAPQTRPALPMSYAGQERAPRPSVFNGDPGARASGPVVAQIPTVAPRQAPVPASPFDRVSARLNALPAVGGPPTTRVVQSVPVRPSQSSGQGINAQRSEQAMTRQATPMPVPVQRAAQAPSDIGRMPSMAEMQATLGRPLSPSAVGGLYDNVFPNPLAPAGVPANPNADIGVATLLDTIDPRTGLRTAAPTGPLAYAMPPMPRSRPYAAMPSMPIPRPGIGGPYRVAPIPAPRTQRPGLFRLGGFELPQLPTAQGLRNTFAPGPLYRSDPIAFGNQAVSHSGDTSVGSQADAAAARASGDSYRANRR